MGRWIGRSLLFIYYLYFLYLQIELFFNLVFLATEIFI